MPSVSPEAPLQEFRPDSKRSNAAENLALLYQGLITGIVRLKSGRQHLPDSETFRKRTKATLQEVERVAIAGGYDARDVRDADFAVVAFLDETVLHSNDPVRAEWERKPLQEELFGKADAGVVFFEKLDQFRSRRDSEQLADVLEVYLLCLLLGFEGRYTGGRRGELEGTMESVRMRIEYIRGGEEPISPCGGLPKETALPTQEERRDHLRLFAAGLMVFTFLLYWVLRLNLASIAEEWNRRLF